MTGIYASFVLRQRMYGARGVGVTTANDSGRKEGQEMRRLDIHMQMQRLSGEPRGSR